jgi:hypothetical protein
MPEKINMQIQKINQDSRQTFGMKLKVGPNLSEVKRPAILDKEIEELRILLDKLTPFNKGAVVDFEKTKTSLFGNEHNYKYVIKPHEYDDVDAHYVPVGNFSSEEKFLNQPLPTEILGIHGQALYA